MVRVRDALNTVTCESWLQLSAQTSLDYCLFMINAQVCRLRMVCNRSRLRLDVVSGVGKDILAC